MIYLSKKTHNTHNEIVCRGQSYIKRVFGIDAEKCKKKGKEYLQSLCAANTQFLARLFTSQSEQKA